VIRYHHIFSKKSLIKFSGSLKFAAVVAEGILLVLAGPVCGG